jgi:type I restriction enzyme M protein
MVKEQIEPNLPSRGGKTRALTKEDFSQRSAIFLRPEAQFDHLVALPDSVDRARAIIEAMESIEADYENLRGTLPKGEYQELDNQVLGQLLRTLNPEELNRVKGDVFGRIYEYFLTQFADQGAHDGGEFFTPISIVSLIAHVLDPVKGTVLDPACGSGGMFVQSARIVEEHGDSPTERLTFRGLEKNATTIRLAKMNLAVHGLEGDIQKAITYYEDPHELVGKADYVMANPPFNVDEIDADKVKSDPRLPFGLPGVNKKDKVSNGNYVWISYFYSYLSDKGRAGFVMSSQASSAGGGEAKVRQKLVETGDVDLMIAIRSNFFLHPHRALRALVPQPQQAKGAQRQGTDARRAQRLPQGHAQDLRFFARAAAEPASHRLALPRRDRALPATGIAIPGQCRRRGQRLFPGRRRPGPDLPPPAGLQRRTRRPAQNPRATFERNIPSPSGRGPG